MNDYINIGRAVKELREAQGLSLRDLARRSGVSASVICRMEASVTWNATIHSISMIAKALGVSVGDLMNYQPSNLVICPHCGGSGWKRVGKD